MGNLNGCCQSRDKPPVQFDGREKFLINQVFHQYCQLSPESSTTNQLTEEVMVEIFRENPVFARQFFRFVVKYQGQVQQEFVDIKALFEILEIMLKDNHTSQNPQMKHLQKFELMILIILENTHFLTRADELKHLQISFIQSIEILATFLRIFHSGRRMQHLDETAARAVSDSIFRGQGGVVTWSTFVDYFKNQLPGVNQIARSYFENKFFAKIYVSPVPQINMPSQLLNQELLSLLHMSATFTEFQNCQSLELLYSSTLRPKNIFELAKVLDRTYLPTILLFSHEEQYLQPDKTMVTKDNIFGAISNSKWIDNAKPNGSAEDCILSLHPYFKIFPSQKRNLVNQVSYCYLNTKEQDQPIGLGFGGQDGKGFRIWIDKSIENQSYCSTRDTVYESGSLVCSHISKLKIKTIEIWGLIPKNCNDLRLPELYAEMKSEPMIKFTYEVNQQVKLDEDINLEASFSSRHSHSASIEEMKFDQRNDSDDESGFEDVIITQDGNHVEKEKKKKSFETVEVKQMREMDSSASGAFSQSTSDQWAKGSFQAEYIQSPNIQHEEYTVQSGAFGSSSSSINDKNYASQKWGSDSSDMGDPSSSGVKFKEVVVKNGLEVIFEELKESSHSVM